MPFDGGARRRIILAGGFVLVLLALGAGISLIVTTSRPAAPARRTDQVIRMGADNENEQATNASTAPDSGEEPPRVPVAEGDAATALEVAVQTVKGFPVEGAKVGIWDDSGLSGIAITREDGIAVLASDDTSASMTLVALGEGFAKYCREYVSPYPKRVTVTLQPQAVISGSAHEDTGVGARAPAPDGSEVYAWPGKSGVPGARTFSTFADLAPHSHRAAVRKDGSFSLTGLAEGAAYVVAAGAPGWAPAKYQVVPSGSVAVDLAVQRVYACAVEAHEADDDGSMMPRCQYTSRVDVARATRDARFVQRDSPDWSLSHLNRLLPSSDWEWRRAVFAVKAPSGRPPSSLRAVYRVAGYEPVDAELPLVPVSNELKVFVVTLHRATNGLGELEVRVIGQPPTAGHPGALSCRPPPATIVLEPRGTETRPIELPLECLRSDRVVYRDLPYGAYVARLVNHQGIEIDGPPQVPERSIVVGPSRAAVSFDVRSLGSIRVSLAPKDASSRERRTLIVDVRAMPPIHREAKVFLRGRPYEIVGLVPGVYRLDVKPWTYGVRLDPVQVSDVRVLRGEMTKVEVSWPF